MDNSSDIIEHKNTRGRFFCVDEMMKHTAGTVLAV